MQPFKMAWRSIVGKKGRSTLTILSIFIGVAAVMCIVSVMEGMKLQVMKQFNAMRWAQIALRYKLRSIHLTKAEIVRALIIFLNCIAIAKG